MPSNLLVLPFLGGFIFVSLFLLTQFYIRRHDRARLLFTSAIAGVFLLGIARTMVIYWLAPEYPELILIKKDIANIPFLGTALLAFVLGLTLWLPLNIIIIALIVLTKLCRGTDTPTQEKINIELLGGAPSGRRGRHETHSSASDRGWPWPSNWALCARAWVIEKCFAPPLRFFLKLHENAWKLYDKAKREIITWQRNDPLERFLRQTIQERQMVSATLRSSGKVIAGYIEKISPDPRLDDSRISMAVLASGHRDENQAMVIDNWYNQQLTWLGLMGPEAAQKVDAHLNQDEKEAYRNLSVDDFTRVINMADIEYIVRFDVGVYASYSGSGLVDPETDARN